MRQPRAQPAPDLIERFTVAIGDTVELDGVTHYFLGMTVESLMGPGASLDRDDHSIDLSMPGCTRDGDYVYAMEALEGDIEPPLLRFRRWPIGHEREIHWGVPFEASPRDTLVGPDGLRVVLSRIVAQPATTWNVWIETDFEGATNTFTTPAYLGVELTSLTTEHLITVLPSEHVDGLCPVATVLIEKPSEQEVPLDEDRDVVLRAGFVGVVGELRIVYSGTGSMFELDGENSAMVMLRFTIGSHVVDEVLDFGETAHVGGYAILVIRTDYDGAHLRIQREEPP